VAYIKLVVFVYLNILAFNNILKIIFLVLQFINPVIVLLDQRFECVCSQWGFYIRFFGVVRSWFLAFYCSGNTCDVFVFLIRLLLTHQNERKY